MRSITFFKTAVKIQKTASELQNNAKFNAAEQGSTTGPQHLMSKILEQLEQFIKDDPHDPFNHYALALEYQKTDVVKAQHVFEKLVAEHSQYVPTYYHLGQLYAGQGKTEEAISIFERGIVVARAAGDQKAVREMEGARLAVLYDN